MINFLLLHYKETLGVLSLLLIVPQIYLYFKSIIIGETKPHIYTKIIWFILTGIGFLIQMSHGGGPGAWILGAVSLTQVISFLLALKYGKADITKFDTLLLIFALGCIPIYLGIEDKIYALITVIFIDMLGYIPTLKKSYINPYTENISVRNISTLKYILSFIALTEYSLYTMSYTLFLITFNIILILILVFRRKFIAKP